LLVSCDRFPRNFSRVQKRRLARAREFSDVAVQIFTAWARTSGDNFWHSRIWQRWLLSALHRSGCSCLSIETYCECV